MPSDNVTEAIDNLTLVMQGIDTTFLLLILVFTAVGLTWAMFQSKQAMLGFPSGIGWFLLAGYTYAEAPFPAAMNLITAFTFAMLGVFAIYAAFGLRTKKEEQAEGDEFIDEGGDKDIRFIDEGKPEREGEPRTSGDERKPKRSYAQEIRDRAAKRRASLRQ